MKANNAYITLADLERYEARAAEPLKITYRGYPVLLTPPSSTGGTTVGFQLRILDRFEVKPEWRAALRSVTCRSRRCVWLRGFGAA